MKKVKESRQTKILDLDEIRAKKQTSTVHILKDSKKIARAISDRTCIICNTRKACVNKAGVCSYCFENELTPQEKKIAAEEAKHKIIKIQVLDDRW